MVNSYKIIQMMFEIALVEGGFITPEYSFIEWSKEMCFVTCKCLNPNCSVRNIALLIL